MPVVSMHPERGKEPFPILESAVAGSQLDPYHTIADTPNQIWFQGPVAPPPDVSSSQIAIPDLTLLDSESSANKEIHNPPIPTEYTGTVLKRLSSTRIPDDHTGLKIDELGPMLDRELIGCRKWDDSGLIKSIFPKYVGKVKVSKILFIDWPSFQPMPVMP